MAEKHAKVMHNKYVFFCFILYVKSNLTYATWDGLPLRKHSSFVFWVDFGVEIATDGLNLYYCFEICLNF